MKTPCHVRWMIGSDRSAVLDIESHNWDPPWDAADFKTCLTGDRCIGRVAEVGGKIVGYVVYEIRRRRAVILNLCVHPEHRRRGIATQLLDVVKKKHCRPGKSMLEAPVLEPNLYAQLFFRSYGFRAEKIVRFPWNDHDAYLMRLRAEQRISQADLDRLFHGP